MPGCICFRHAHQTRWEYASQFTMRGRYSLGVKGNHCLSYLLTYLCQSLFLSLLTVLLSEFGDNCTLLRKMTGEGMFSTPQPFSQLAYRRRRLFSSITNSLKDFKAIFIIYLLSQDTMMSKSMGWSFTLNNSLKRGELAFHDLERCGVADIAKFEDHFK